MVALPPPVAVPAPRSGTSFSSTQSAASMQRRRRKHDHPAAANQNGGSVDHPANGTATSKPLDHKNGSTFKRGDRTKVLRKTLILFTVLFVWVSLFLFEYRTLTNSNTAESITNSYTKESIPKKPEGSPQTTTSSQTRNHPYDSIFCPAGSKFQKSQSTASKNAHNSNKPVFLWGIPSTVSVSETRRRALLRKTYLDFFPQITNDPNYRTAVKNATFYNAPNRICSFHEWTCDALVREHCQMIYVFFVGGHDPVVGTNATAIETTTANTTTTANQQLPLPPPILLNESITDFRDMLIVPPDNKKGFDLLEPGTVYLDIRENQFDGKMTTWFKFASLVAKEYNAAIATTSSSSSTTEAANNYFPKIEYIFKVDSDLMLLTPNFFSWFDAVHGEQQRLQGISSHQQNQQQQTRQSTVSQTDSLVQRVYGGIEFPNTNCVVNFTFDHPCPLPLSGPSYMSGELNFVSVDLATYIASDNCPRDEWTIPHEDVSLSNYVYSYTNNTDYHKREQQQQRQGQSKNSVTDKDHSIHIVSVNTSRILLLPNMRADWQTVSLRKNPDLLRQGEFLWGHSIKRGNHTQYLYWKKDAKFLGFWNFFYKVYTTTGMLTAVTRRKKPDAPANGGGGENKNANNTKKKEIADSFKAAIRKRQEERLRKKKEDAEGTLKRIKAF